MFKFGNRVTDCLYFIVIVGSADWKRAMSVPVLAGGQDGYFWPILRQTLRTCSCRWCRSHTPSRFSCQSAGDGFVKINTCVHVERLLVKVDKLVYNIGLIDQHL